MLNTKLSVLVALWVLGLFLHMARSPIHLFLGISVGVLLVDMIGRHRRAL